MIVVEVGHTALFSLLGTTYGGNGQSTFGLPNMQDNVANSFGQGPGLSLYDQGEQSGQSAVTLISTEMPMHNHSFSTSTSQGTTTTSAGNELGLGQGGTKQ